VGFERPVLKRSKIGFQSNGQKVLFCDNNCKINGNIFENKNNNDLTDNRINCVSDLTASNGDILLMEYSEEEPPLVMRVGMGSKIINYFKVFHIFV